jgi:hypothetical protein
MSEYDLQIAVASVLDDLMEQRKLFWFHPPNSIYTSKSQAGKHKAQGMKAGVPDCAITLPEGKSLYIEIKFGRGNLSKAQKEIADLLDELKVPNYMLKTDNPYTIKDMVRSVLRENGVQT